MQIECVCLPRYVRAHSTGSSLCVGTPGSSALLGSLRGPPFDTIDLNPGILCSAGFSKYLYVYVWWVESASRTFVDSWQVTPVVATYTLAIIHIQGLPAGSMHSTPQVPHVAKPTADPLNTTPLAAQPQQLEDSFLSHSKRSLVMTGFQALCLHLDSPHYIKQQMRSFHFKQHAASSHKTT